MLHLIDRARTALLAQADVRQGRPFPPHDLARFIRKHEHPDLTTPAERVSWDEAHPVSPGTLQFACDVLVAKGILTSTRQQIRSTEVDGVSNHTARTTLGSALREARLSSGQSIRALGRVTGLGGGYLGQIERGRIRHPSPQRLAVLATAYGLSLDRLLDLAGLTLPLPGARMAPAVPEFVERALAILSSEDWEALREPVETQIAVRQTAQAQQGAISEGRS